MSLQSAQQKERRGRVALYSLKNIFSLGQININRFGIQTAVLIYQALLSVIVAE